MGSSIQSLLIHIIIWRKYLVLQVSLGYNLVVVAILANNNDIISVCNVSKCYVLLVLLHSFQGQYIDTLLELSTLL